MLDVLYFDFRCFDLKILITLAVAAADVRRKSVQRHLGTHSEIQVFEIYEACVTVKGGDGMSCTTIEEVLNRLIVYMRPPLPDRMPWSYLAYLRIAQTG